MLWCRGLTSDSYVRCWLDLDIGAVTCKACKVKPSEPIVICADTPARVRLKPSVSIILRELGYGNRIAVTSEREIPEALKRRAEFEATYGTPADPRGDPRTKWPDS